jgi:hypothetical protein
MNKKLDWYTEKRRRPKGRQPFAKITDIHEDKRRYDRSKDREELQQIRKEYIK